MSFIKSLFFIFLLNIVFISSTYQKTTTNASPQRRRFNTTTTVHIITSNPSNKLIRIRVSNTKQSFYSLETTLKWGESYKFVAEERCLYYCEAIWGRFMGSWHGFQPKRDLNNSVFWLIKPNGFFLSWDNSTWVKKALWETE
ncbi:hypothetical protein G4B88_026769 [Cannabis sativa]|uniref:S-protein homolog n=1 Tax=Cannabis sativa TaxID=3483 RepID=A0A7J6F9A3_CANSA|nr:hypothetical protein G4B88_026769 [Cannabis sativa]